MDAPTQYASMALSLTPNKAIHADLGYRISAVMAISSSTMRER